MTKKKTHEEFSCSVDLTNTESLSTKEEDLLADSTKTKTPEASTELICTEEGEATATESNPIGFDGFGFSDNLIQTLEERGYKEPSPIQKAAFPELMLGRDLVGQAQTGTGKTAAFALPILERIKKNQKLPQVLVLAPTRELAMQVADSFRTYGAKLAHLKVLPVYGGTEFRAQISALRNGVEIIVGTPGRVMDHIRQGTLITSELNCLVLDEADEMLRMGFIDDVEWILDHLPNERQMVLFSATMPSQIRNLSKRYLNNPAEITIKSKKKEAKLIRQRFITVQNSYKLETLKRVLESFDIDGVIIFVRTKAITLTVAEELEATGHDVAVLNGDVPQNQRERTVDRLKKGAIDILVATDVAARGLDVERIGLVINYDMPFDSEAYVHRIGRTGRAGRTGEAILFVNPRERHFLGGLERAIGQSVEPMEVPNNALINKNRVEKLRKKLVLSAQEGREHEGEAVILEALIQEVAEELQIDQKEIALAAINLAVGAQPLLTNSNENWIKQSLHKSRRNDRREDRFNGRRRNDRESGSPENNMERFRVEVGHRDRVKPGNLVGAIANGSGLQGKMIGRIQIFEDHSLIDLPKGMPNNVFNDLKKLKVMNRELQIHRSSN